MRVAAPPYNPGMPMPTAVVSDSNVSLPPNVVRGLPLFLAPLQVRIGEQVYADGVDITPAEFYTLLRSSGDPPTTAAPSPGAFLDAIRRAGDAADEIICITLSAELSATYSAAKEAVRLARAQLPHLSVSLVDSRSAGAAQGLIALDAARLAASGASAGDVLARVERRIGNTHFIGYLSTLYYLWRGGRVPRLFMWMGSMLQMKPILQLSAGRIGMVERPRTEAKALARLTAMAAERTAGRPVRAAVTHAAEPERAAMLAEQLRSRLCIEELFITEFTPAIGAHTGPGLVGCAFHVTD